MATAGRSFLDWQVHDATLRFASSPPQYLMSRARKLVDAKFQRGDYEMLQAMDDETRDNLAKQLIKALGK